jgi:RNA polymerase sigma-70 factor (ECF subfamily)
MTHEQFIRLFLNAERELLRYVMVLVPNVSDARDVVQETAISLWQAIDKYDPTKPFIPWACRFALNEARMHLRKAARQRRYLEEDVAKLLSERRIEIASSLDTRREHLRDCLNRLPDDQRQIVRGYYFDEEAIDSLASQLGRGTESIYKSLQRIRQALHQCIERKIKAEC